MAINVAAESFEMTERAAGGGGPARRAAGIEPEPRQTVGKRKSHGKMTSRGRIGCISVSTILAFISLIIILICLFSASFHYSLDNAGGTKNYGIIRFCYTPKDRDQTRNDDSNSKMCHLRNYVNTQYCQEPRENGGHADKSTRECYGDFELATLILMICSMVCVVLALCFAICTIFTSFGALAHSVILIAAAICSISGFLTYTYFYELKDNQYEVVLGYQYQIHYSWAYYLFGFSSLLQFAAFVCSLFGSAFVLVHKNRKRQAKVQSISL